MKSSEVIAYFFLCIKDNVIFKLFFGFVFLSAIMVIFAFFSPGKIQISLLIDEMAESLIFQGTGNGK